MSKVLEETTVIDFTQYRAGPWASNILGELGAEVIKVERPGSGDPSRSGHPELSGIGHSFAAKNRHKKSIAIDLKDHQGRQVAEELIAEADILLENYSLGVMESFGLGYEYLSEEVNPELIYASGKGYGEEGPSKEKRGLDLIMQAEGGFMSITGDSEGPPMKAGQAIGDIGCGLYLTIAVLGALQYRERTGEGQKVESNLFGTIVSFLEEYITEYGITGENPDRQGNSHQSIVPYGLFEAEDRPMVIGAGHNEEAWERFVTEVLEDERFLKYDSEHLRQEHREEIETAINEKLRERPAEEWDELLEGFPRGPLNYVSDVVEHPHARSRGYVFDHDDPNFGEMTLHGYPLHFSEGERNTEFAIPTLGEHTDEVLRNILGFDGEEIDNLRDRGVVE